MAGSKQEKKTAPGKPPPPTRGATKEPPTIEWTETEKQDLDFGRFVGFAFSGFVLAVYLRTMHPTVAGGDSGELMGAACELGVAHPPGYPLFTMLSWLGTQVIPVGSPGYRMNCVSVFFGVLASFFHYKAVLRWHLGMYHPRNGPNSEWIGSAWIAMLASGLMSFCPLIWQYSTHAEVFAMNNMFIAILLYLAVRYVQEVRVEFARLGALFIGLGLSNQHTLVLYAFPLVVWMLYLGRQQLLCFKEMSILVLLGLLGLSPYLYLFWAATHAPLGSWGDTSTLSGWPAVGFWTHFLRKEYGTFALYSGKESSSGINQLLLALKLYSKSVLRSDTLFLGFAAPIGLLSSVHQNGFQSYGAVIASMIIFYMLVFHYLANLPLDKPLFFGVHVRFWMQPHMIVFAFLGMGCDKIFSQLASSRRFIVIFFTLAAIAAQLGINWEKVDQSDNWYTYDFGKALLDPRPEHAVLLTQGDVVTNSVRYHQRCEKYRLDVAHLDMPMMTYEWFKTMHGPHFPHPPWAPPIKFPGVQFAVGATRLKEHRKCCPYSMKQFLDANFPSKRAFYLVGGWYGTEMPNGQDPVGIPGYLTEPVGTAMRIITGRKRLKSKEYKEEVRNFTIPERLPDMRRKYDLTSWEYTILVNYISYSQALWVNRMERAVAKGKEPDPSPWIKEQKELVKIIKNLEKLIVLAEREGIVDEDLYRNAGIAYGRLKCDQPNLYPQVDCLGQTKMREMMKKFLAVTKKPKHVTQNEQLVVDNPTKFINLG